MQARRFTAKDIEALNGLHRAIRASRAGWAPHLGRLAHGEIQTLLKDIQQGRLIHLTKNPKTGAWA